MTRILVDTNIANEVFDTQRKKYSELRNFICLPSSQSIMVLGGTKMLDEYKNILIRYKNLFKELKNINRFIILPREEVDNKVVELKQLISAKKFDDPHIVACVIIGKVNIVCTADKRCDKYLKMDSLFPSPKLKPKIYRHVKQHKHLLTC